MLCTFTTAQGETLVVRSDDIRMILDINDGDSALVWLIGETTNERRITGTALENMARIQQEELDLVARVEGHRQMLAARMQAGYPAQPVKRGKS